MTEIPDDALGAVAGAMERYCDHIGEPMPTPSLARAMARAALAANPPAHVIDAVAQALKDFTPCFSGVDPWRERAKVALAAADALWPVPNDG